MTESIYDESTKPSYLTDRAAYNKWYYLQNKEKLKTQTAQYYDSKKESREERQQLRIQVREANKATRDEAIAAHNKEWYRDNKALRDQYAKKYRDANKGYYAQYSRIYINLKRQAFPTWADVDKINLIYKKCAELNERFNLTGNDKLCVDHIVPITSDVVCGLHTWDNLQLLSKSLNSIKSNSLTDD